MVERFSEEFMNDYLRSESLTKLLRLPLGGILDLTYRCNNNCRHCWLRLSPSASEQQQELGVDEIKAIVDQARREGCRKWSISGGEPMLRSDFAEIFDYITSRSVSYSINTNGTMITPEIADLLRRKGSKMVALYGATAEVHDHITRNPGSFQATMRGFELLKDAGAGFTVQLIPMKDNYHQFQDMVRLAESISPHWRVGAAWLYLSACGSPQRNAEIASQRLSPRDVITLDKPDVSYEDLYKGISCQVNPSDDRLFASCIEGRSEFHIDPYGQMTFCSYIKDPKLRYDLRKGSFQESWYKFIPSLAGKVKGGREYRENCGSCTDRLDCRWCPVYAFLEHGRYEAKIDYLCSVAKERRAFKDDWKLNHRRYYQIAEITVQVDSDLPFTDETFDTRFKHFQVDGPGLDTIFIHHHFNLPDLKGLDIGQEVYRRPPWAIYRKDRSWIYLGIFPDSSDHNLHRVATFSDDHSRARIYNDRDDLFLKGRLHSLTLFPTDQILLSRVLAERKGCILHSAGMILGGKGLLFVGHSGAGKSTTAKMMMDKAEILCDDRNIVRRWPEGFKVHGSWSHGEIPIVSSASAPLNAILFLKKSDQNRITPLTDRKEIVLRLMACLVKPFKTADWWQKMLSLLEEMAREVPCYIMEFDRSGEIVHEIENKVVAL